MEVEQTQERIYKERINLAELVEDSNVVFGVSISTLSEGKKIFLFDGVYIGKSELGVSGQYARFIFRKEKHRFSHIKGCKVGSIGVYNFRISKEGNNEYIDFDDFRNRQSGFFDFEKLHTQRHRNCYWAWDEILRRHGKWVRIQLQTDWIR